MKNRLALQVIALFCLLAPGLSFALEGDQESTVTISLGKMKFGGMLQAWALNDTTHDSYATNEANSNFRLRRAEMKLTGSVHPQTRWFLMVDPAKGPKSGAVSAANDNKILQDIGTAFEFASGWEIQIGQFKQPTFTEGFQASSELLFPERSATARYFSDRRDPGVMLTANFKPLTAKIMVSNGISAANGQVTTSTDSANVTDTDNSKDVTGRVDYALSDKLSAGIFGSNSSFGNGRRGGVNVHFNSGKCLLKVDAVQAQEFKVDKNGLVVDAAYSFTDKLQAAVRHESLNQTNTGKLHGEAETFGVNYLHHGHNLKVQLAYTRLYNMVGNDGSYKMQNLIHDGSLTALNVQTAF